MGDTALAEAPTGPALDDAGRDALVLEMIRLHADGLLRLARRHSLNDADAQDAYQRGLEIFLRHAHRLDPERAASWLRTVVKHEAMAVRRTRQRDLAALEVDFDLLEARTTASPEDRALTVEHVARSAEALHRLKPQEVRALWLRAQGNSYDEIQELTGWTRTKVNRCLYEGRQSFLKRYAGIESGAECERWAPLLSALVDGEATPEQLLELRPHLRACGSCRGTLRELQRSSASLAGVFPLGVVTLTTDAAEPAGQLFVRVYETVTAWLGERAAATFVRAQLLVDAVSASAGKATAVAAASAAVAGGGAVAIQQVAPEPQRAAQVAPVGRAIDASGSVRELAIDREVSRRLADERRAAARRAVARERRRAAQAARTPSPAGAATTTTAGTGASLAPGPTPAAAPAPAAAPKRTPAAAAPAPRTAPAPAAAELGLE
jgi:RNA polymerase sigma factor (sigma-70 family)